MLFFLNTNKQYLSCTPFLVISSQIVVKVIFWNGIKNDLTNRTLKYCTYYKCMKGIALIAQKVAWCIWFLNSNVSKNRDYDLVNTFLDPEYGLSPPSLPKTSLISQKIAFEFQERVRPSTFADFPCPTTFRWAFDFDVVVSTLANRFSEHNKVKNGAHALISKNLILIKKNIFISLLPRVNNSG